jgi:hypothetical protein
VHRGGKDAARQAPNSAPGAPLKEIWMEARPPRAEPAAVIRLFATMDGVNASLAKAIANGTYVIDPHAVAAAMIERRAEARRLSAVLESPQANGDAVGCEHDEPIAGADVA